MKKKKLMKGNEGITLVALVVTIVVLLILAGISLNLVLGENGIITRAQEEELTLRKVTAMVFQEYNLFANKTIIENITTPLTVVKKLTKEKALVIAREQLKKLVYQIKKIVIQLNYQEDNNNVWLLLEH